MPTFEPRHGPEPAITSKDDKCRLERREQMSSLEPPSTPAAERQAFTAPEEGPSSQPRRNSIWSRLKTILAFRPGSLRQDLREALEEEANGETPEFSDNERVILQNVLNLGTLKVDDVSVPRSDIVAIELNSTMGQLIARFRAAGHSRLPVYDEELDKIVGFIHIKDALRAVTAASAAPNGEMPVKFMTPVLRQRISRLNIIREVVFVPPSMPVAELLQHLRKSRVHLAIVIDEYGGTDGLVSIEDLLEAVVGEIDDEHDVAGPKLVKQVDENTYLADARAELEDLQAVIGPDFNPGRLGEDIDTVGGFVFDLVDRVPGRGEVIAGPQGYDFEILAADSRRIKRLRILRQRPILETTPTTPPQTVEVEDPGEPVLLAPPRDGQGEGPRQAAQ